MLTSCRRLSLLLPRSPEVISYVSTPCIHCCITLQAWAPRDVNTPPSPLVSGSHDIMPPAPSSTEYSGNRPSGLASGGGSGSRNLKSALSMASNNGQPQLWMGSSKWTLSCMPLHMQMGSVEG
jgi:hypothetical protein